MEGLGSTTEGKSSVNRCPDLMLLPPPISSSAPYWLTQLDVKRAMESIEAALTGQLPAVQSKLEKSRTADGKIHRFPAQEVI